MPSANGFGISKIAGASIEAVELSYDSETKMLMDSNGDFAQARVSDVSIGFTVRGSGTTGVTIGGTSGAPTGVSGKVVITSVKHTQTNEDFERFEYSGICYPSAS